jgi:hypothetical protein
MVYLYLTLIIKTMNLTISVNDKQENLSQAQFNMLRRMVNVMNEHDFDVDLLFSPEDPHNRTVYSTKFAGGRYPCVGKEIQISRTIAYNKL